MRKCLCRLDVDVRCVFQLSELRYSWVMLFLGVLVGLKFSSIATIIHSKNTERKHSLFFFSEMRFSAQKVFRIFDFIDVSDGQFLFSKIFTSCWFFFFFTFDHHSLKLLQANFSYAVHWTYKCFVNNHKIFRFLSFSFFFLFLVFFFFSGNVTANYRSNLCCWHLIPSVGFFFSVNSLLIFFFLQSTSFFPIFSFIFWTKNIGVFLFHKNLFSLFFFLIILLRHIYFFEILSSFYK